MTKAERIFKDTYTECRLFIKRHGYEENTGFNAFIMNDDESVCTRTFNAISKLIASERKSIEISEKLGIGNTTLNRQALNMVEATLNNCIKSHAIVNLDLCDIMCN